MAGVDLLAMPTPTPTWRPTSRPCATSALIPDGTRVQGWRYDVETGLVHQVIV